MEPSSPRPADDDPGRRTPPAEAGSHDPVPAYPAPNPARPPPHLLSTGMLAAAPGLLGLALVAVGGWLAPGPALIAAAFVVAAAIALCWRPLRAAEALRLRLDRLAEAGADAEAAVTSAPPAMPVLGDVDRAVRRLVQAWRLRLDALASSAARADRVIDALPDPLILIDGRRHVIRANRAARELAGTALVGRDIATGLRHPMLLDAVDAVLAGGPGRNIEIALPVPVPRSYMARVEPLAIASAPAGRAAAGRATVLVALHDLTAVQRGERMRADFVANVSHELRTPLASLLGFIETLRGPARDDAAAREKFLSIMHDQAERMTRLVDDLLSLSRIELGEHTRPTARVDIAAVLRSVEQTLAAKARGCGIAIQLDLAPDLPPVTGDADQLVQVFQNLIDNAVKYGREGTAVELRAAPTAQNMVAVSIRDHGEGIPREHLPRLTERFYRVDAARSRALGGTGLGLAIVKHILNRHRGRLAIESTPGEGSVFTVTLPAVQGPAPEPRSTEPRPS